MAHSWKQEPEVHTTAIEWVLSGGMYTSPRLSATSVSSISHYPFYITQFWLSRQSVSVNQFASTRNCFAQQSVILSQLLRPLEGHALQVLQYSPKICLHPKERMLLNMSVSYQVSYQPWQMIGFIQELTDGQNNCKRRHHTVAIKNVLDRHLWEV